MGIYTSNRYLNEAYDYASEIPANEAYDAAFGCAHILADCQVNDMALFESAIYSDFAEVKALQEGYGYINENAFTDVLKKIAEMFKKLLAKIKGVFAAFIAKLTGAFKDGKKLVKQYEKQIIKYSNWKDFKCKGVYKLKSGNDSISAINTLFKYSDSTVGVNAGIYKLNLLTSANTAFYNNNEIKTLFGSFDVEKLNELEAEDIKNALLKNYTTISDAEYEEFHKNVQEALYDEDEKEINGEDSNIGSSFFTAPWIKGVLNDDKWEKNVKKFNERLEKNINTIIDNLNKGADDLATWRAKNGSDAKLSTVSTSNNDKNFADSDNGKIKKSNTKDWTTNNGGLSSEIVQRSIAFLQKVAGHEQEVISKVTSEYMTQVKFAMAQARKLWTAAAAWSSGVHKESVEYTNAVAECAAEQFYMNMEAVY